MVNDDRHGKEVTEYNEHDAGAAEDSEPDEEVKYACTEARNTLDQQVEAIRRMDQRAFKMARANLILLGVLIGSFSSIPGGENLTRSAFLNPHSAIGALLLIASSIIAGMGFLSSRVELGPGPVVISAASEMPPNRFYSEIKTQYSKWLKENKRLHTIVSYAIEWVIVLTIVGVIFLIGGFAVGFTKISGSLWSWGLLITEIIFALFLFFLITKTEKIVHSVRENY